MRRLAGVIGATLVANAIGLGLAVVLLGDDMTVDAPSFVLAVVVFSVVEVLAQAVIVRAGTRHLPVLVGASALLATLVGLGAAVVLADGLRIRGVASWVLATVIVWAAAVIAGLLLPRVLPLVRPRGSRRAGVRAGARPRSRSRRRSGGRRRRRAATGRPPTWRACRGPPARAPRDRRGSRAASAPRTR